MQIYALLKGLPLALGAVTLAMLAVGHMLWPLGVMMIAWGTLNSVIPVAWSTWLTKGVSDEPESGGSLTVAAIQLSIMLGAAFGGFLLDHTSIAATLTCGACVVTVGNRDRIRPRAR